jgi:glycosyltransferase involved in cell wall biosynthesis
MKILEAMALGSPIVSTTIGAEGLDLENGRDLLIADSPALFAEAAIALLRDAGLRQTLGLHARETAVRRFSWERVAAEFEAIYHSVKPWKQ